MSAEASRVVEDNDKEKKGKERVKKKKRYYGYFAILSTIREVVLPNVSINTA